MPRKPHGLSSLGMNGHHCRAFKGEKPLGAVDTIFSWFREIVLIEIQIWLPSKKINAKFLCMKRTIQKTFSYRLEPTRLQRMLFAQYAGCVRFVFNYGLSLIKKAFDSKTKIPTYTDIANLLPSLKRATETAWLKKVHSQVLQQALKDLENALKHFFRGIKSKQNIGFPRFKCKGIKDSFRYPQYVEYLDGKVYLPKIGWVGYRDSRPLEGIIKQAVVKRRGDRWFVHIVCDVEVEISSRIVSTDNIVGIDLGLTHLAHLSNGQVYENPKHLKSDLGRLQFLQRAYSRKQKGSKNQKKAAKKVGKQHIKIADKRQDYINKVSTAIVENQDGVIVENLNIKGMIKNRYLARSIADAGWYKLISCLKYKADWQGKPFVVIDRFAPTSKACSSCGDKKDMPLSIRRYLCEACGLDLDRDFNAAINIRAAGLAVLACGGLNIGSPSEAGIAGF